MKNYTEPIFVLLAGLRAALREHPFLVAARSGGLPLSTLHAFAWYQFSDSILWIPMLAQMRTKAQRSDRLRRAIAENIAHEAGLHAASHVSLAVGLMRSLGIRDSSGFREKVFSTNAGYWLSDEADAMEDPEIAGWLLTAETLVPDLFGAVLPSFAEIGADTKYFDEHVEVDGDEHSVWMAESVAEVVEIYGVNAVPRIIRGMLDAWAETREVPDLLSASV